MQSEWFGTRGGVSNSQDGGWNRKMSTSVGAIRWWLGNDGNTQDGNGPFYCGSEIKSSYVWDEA
jgi:hypothetical protein